MVLTESMLRFGYWHSRALLAVAPGGTAARLEVERRLRDAGGNLAANAADADTLMLCGRVAGALRDAADQVFRQMPVPRARAVVADPSQAGEALEAATFALRDMAVQSAQAEENMDGGAHLRTIVESHDHSDGDHGHDAGEGNGGMMMPAGLAMAARAPDRDGLKLDQLHIQLGPVLPHWPAGLVLKLVVQGDVVQQADVTTLGLDARSTPEPAFWDAPEHVTGDRESLARFAMAGRIAASHLDSVTRLLAVSGWADGAAIAARLRDGLLAASPDLGCCSEAVSSFARRVRRSRLLRWSLRDVGSLPTHLAIAAGVTGPALRAGGDAWDRLCCWLEEMEMALRGGQIDGEGPRGPIDQRPPTAALLDALPALVTGADLAAVRIVVASLDPDLDQLVGSSMAPSHG